MKSIIEEIKKVTNEEIITAEPSLEDNLSIVDSRGFRAKSISDYIPKEYYSNKKNEKRLLQYKSYINDYEVLF